MNRLRPTIIALSLATLQSVGMAATPDADVPTRSVSFAQADLARPGGTDALYRRIRQAAREVCAVYDAPGADHLAHFRHCVSEATARAVADAGIPQLTRRYLALSPASILPGAQARLNR